MTTLRKFNINNYATYNPRNLPVMNIYNNENNTFLTFLTIPSNIHSYKFLEKQNEIS